MSSVQLISLYLCMNSAELLLCPWGDSRGHLHGHDEWITNEKKLKSKAAVHFNNWARELDQHSLSWSDSFEAHTGKGEEMQRYGPVAPKHRHLSCYTPEPPSSFGAHKLAVSVPLMALFLGGIYGDWQQCCKCVCVCIKSHLLMCPPLTGSAGAPAHMLPGAFATHSYSVWVTHRHIKRY